MKQILSFIILQCFMRIDSGAVKEMHKEDVRIRPCLSAMNWDNPCRLFNLVPPSFLCMIVHRRLSAGRKGNSRNIINVQKWLLVYLQKTKTTIWREHSTIALVQDIFSSHTHYAQQPKLRKTKQNKGHSHMATHRAQHRFSLSFFSLDVKFFCHSTYSKHVLTLHALPSTSHSKSKQMLPTFGCPMQDVLQKSTFLEWASSSSSNPLRIHSPSFLLSVQTRGT